MKKIAQIILAVAIVALVYVIYDQISTPIRFEQDVCNFVQNKPTHV